MPFCLSVLSATLELSAPASGTAERSLRGEGIKIPLLRPAPPQLSLAVEELQSLEQSGIFSNFGPVNRRFEQEMLERFFGGVGACMTVCNATIGLMLAIKEAIGEAVGDAGRGQYALMPSFTFAAAAHAALWCGLKPLFCDIHPTNWAADSASRVGDADALCQARLLWSCPTQPSATRSI